MQYYKNITTFNALFFHGLIKKIFFNRYIIRNIYNSINDIKLHSWNIKVPSFGQLNCILPINVALIPLDSIQFPEMNQFFIHLLSNPAVNQSIRENWKDHLDVHILCEDIINIYGNISKSDRKEWKDIDASLFTCLIELPIKYDINLNLSGNASASLERLEGTHIKIVTERGHCNCNTIKSGNIKVFSQSGSIHAIKLLQGNIDIILGDCGTITGDRLQGQSINLKTISGDIYVKALYGQTSFVASQYGNIRLGNVHSDTTVDNKSGNINIDTLDGNLKTLCESGNTSIHISRHQQVDLASEKGNITIKLPEDTASNLELSAHTISLDDKLPINQNLSENGMNISGILNGENNSFIKARTMEGIIRVEAQDWLSSLNLHLNK